MGYCIHGFSGKKAKRSLSRAPLFLAMPSHARAKGDQLTFASSPQHLGTVQHVHLPGSCQGITLRLQLPSSSISAGTLFLTTEKPGACVVQAVPVMNVLKPLITRPFKLFHLFDALGDISGVLVNA